MKFRLWLERAEQTQTTQVWPHFESSPKSFTYTIYKNPTTQELKKTLEDDKKFRELVYQMAVGYAVRGFLSNNDDIFIWPEGAAAHEDVAALTDNYISIPFYISQEFDTTTWMGGEALKRLKQSPNYANMMGTIPEPEQAPSPYEYSGKTWDDATKPRKVMPGGFEKLPYEWVDNN